MITPERLKEVTIYNKKTGSFVWKVSLNTSIKVGSPAGANHGDGYIAIKIDKKSYLAHRLIWLYVYGRWPKNQIDHMNGDRADNRISNLREVTSQENTWNQRKPNSLNTSGLLGASKCKDTSKWKATIKINGKCKHLGCFKTKELAHVAYIKAKRKYHTTCTL